MNRILSPSSSDDVIEQEIVAKGLTAPRITLDQIEAKIVQCVYINAGLGVWQNFKTGDVTPSPALDLLTICVLVLENGFTVTGESACASPDNFDEGIGRKIARAKAIDKVWMLEGYRLKQTLHAAKFVGFEVDPMKPLKTYGE